MSASAFPWTSNGITFQSRGHFERTIEKFASNGDKAQLHAAKTLLINAKHAKKVSTDQYTEIVKRLHI